MAYNPYYGYPQFTPQPQPEVPKQMQYSVVNSPSIEYARNYPVAPGNSVAFNIDGQPYLCTKSMGFSLMDKPVFEIYKRLEEEKEEIHEDKPEYALKEDIASLEDRLSEIEKALKPKKRVKEDTENE